jgi:hypothetical protein
MSRAPTPPRRGAVLAETAAILHLASVEGAEQWARQELHRPLKRGELERVIERGLRPSSTASVVAESVG